MSNNLIPFGKYKGQPIEAIQEDRQYIDWLLAQNWFRERHQDFYTVIVNNFQEAADTPEHNAMHVKFLNDDYVLELLGRYKSEIKDLFITSRSFESDGWDVAVNLSNYSNESLDNQIADIKTKLDARLESCGYNTSEAVFIQYGLDIYSSFDGDSKIKEDDDFFALSRQLKKLRSSVVNQRFFIEIKPTISDDFPAVLRQIKALKQTSNVILLVGKYTGAGATQEQFVAFMQTENITVIFDESAA